MKRNEYDAVVVGAGVAGIYALYKLRQLGLSVRVLETGASVGGTWYWNRYPGARCDAESLDYSYSFSEELQREWDWPLRFSSQTDILKYLNHVVDRHNLSEYFEFESTVVSAHYDESAGVWCLRTPRGVLRSRYVLMATGILSVPKSPRLPGLSDFKGSVYFTSKWPKNAESLRGKRVGVIGTGSSGVQVIPEIAREASSLTVFQRTPSYSVPSQNAPYDPAGLADYRSRYVDIRALERESAFATYWSAFEMNDRSALDVSADEREMEYEMRWRRGGLGFGVAYNDLMTNLAANRTAADFVRKKIGEIVRDPIKAQKLKPPEDQPLMCRRLSVNTGYYEVFNQSNVDLVDLREEPIDSIESNTISTKTRRVHLDVLILATGFDPILGALSAIDIRGKGGLSLAMKWREGPRNYLGIVTAGFPNMFLINGPLGINGNFITASELVVDWLAELIRFAEGNGFREIDTRTDAENRWVQRVRESAEPAVVLHASGCNAWWAKRDHLGKPAIFLLFMSGIGEYMRECRQVSAAGYRGFEFK